MSLIDPPKLPIYFPRGTVMYKCPQGGCEVEGTYEQMQEHHRVVHLGLPPKVKPR